MPPPHSLVKRPTVPTKQSSMYSLTFEGKNESPQQSLLYSLTVWGHQDSSTVSCVRPYSLTVLQSEATMLPPPCVFSCHTSCLSLWSFPIVPLLLRVVPPDLYLISLPHVVLLSMKCSDQCSTVQCSDQQAPKQTSGCRHWPGVQSQALMLWSCNPVCSP